MVVFCFVFSTSGDSLYHTGSCYLPGFAFKISKLVTIIFDNANGILELLFSWRISALSKRAREKERENDRKRDVLQSMSEATRLVVRHAAANLN